MYHMGDQADKILTSFGLSDGDKKKYDVVKEKFENILSSVGTRFTNEQSSTRGGNSQVNLLTIL